MELPQAVADVTAMAKTKCSSCDCGRPADLPRPCRRYRTVVRLRTVALLAAVAVVVMTVGSVLTGVEAGDQTRRCQEITIPMCKGIGYNYTYMPNQFNHESQDEAGLEVHQFLSLIHI